MRIALQDFKKAVENSMGNKTVIAKRLGVTWVGLWKYLNKHSELNEDIKYEQLKLMDIAHSRLVDKVNKGEDWAIKFIMTNMGGVNGWQDRPQVQIIGKQQNTQINIDNVRELIKNNEEIWN